jgi:hypothetical protein
MKSLDLCCEMDRELSSWRNKLHDVTEKFDREPSISKYRLQPHIEGLHILETEMDDRLEQVRSECKFEVNDLKLKSRAPEKLFDYEIGCC